MYEYEPARSTGATQEPVAQRSSTCSLTPSCPADDGLRSPSPPCSANNTRGLWREKTRRQNSRLLLGQTACWPASAGAAHVHMRVT
jgi:hypothetical protein